MSGADTAAMDFPKLKSRLVRFGDLALRALLLMLVMLFLLFKVVSDPVSVVEFILMVAYQLPSVFVANPSLFLAGLFVLAFAACFAVFWRPLVFVPVVFVAAVVAGLLAHSSVMGVYDKWFPADVVAPVGLPIYEVTPKVERVPFFETDAQVETVADLLEVDAGVVQASVDESLEVMGESGAFQYVRIPIACGLPVESSLAAASFLHPGYVWKSTEIEAQDFHAFGIDLAPGFDEVANTASASWDVTGAAASGVKADIDDNDCHFSLMGFTYDFEVVGYTEVSRSAADARRDILGSHSAIFEYPRHSFAVAVTTDSDWEPARITYAPEAKSLMQDADFPHLVHPVFFVGDGEFGGRYDDAYAPVDPAVAADDLDSMKSYNSMLD